MWIITVRPDQRWWFGDRRLRARATVIRSASLWEMRYLDASGDGCTNFDSGNPALANWTIQDSGYWAPPVRAGVDECCTWDEV